MFRNYLVVAFRNVSKNKVFSLINVLGLAIGVAACLLIFGFVSLELSYDTFNERFSRTYRVTNDRFQNGKLIQHGTIMYPTIGAAMAKDFPEIEEHTRIMPAGILNVKLDDKNFRGGVAYFADEHFFSVFSYKLLAGDRTSLLKEPFRAVLTESLAARYFGVSRENYDDVIGKIFYWGLDTQPYTVQGVCENIPSNSHLRFDALCSYVTLYSGEDKAADNSWTWSDMYHYLVLKPGADYKQLEAKFPAFSERYFNGDKVSGSVEKFYLQPLKDIHLYSNYEYDLAVTASGKAVWAMLIVALFILVIAWINYINLTTSRALDRAKEVGLRKVLGAVKAQLVKQFIVESIIITAVAFIMAVVLVSVLQSSFNEILRTEFSWSTILSSLSLTHAGFVIMVLVLGALLAGFYPALVLSSYQPVKVLKGKFTRSSTGNFLRKSLVVFQFTASVALIVATFLVGRQIEFMNKADLGIDIHNMLTIQSPELAVWDSSFIQHVESYKNEMLQVEGVVSATTTGRLPGDRLGRSFDIRLADSDTEAYYTMSVMNVDYSFFDTYRVSLLAGRKFLPTDHHAEFEKLNKLILNKSAIRLLGFESPEAAIGREIFDGTNKWTIVGAVSDFHQEGLQKPMEPISFRPTYSPYSPTSVRLKTQDLSATMSGIKAVYEKFFPGNSFEYTFLEDRYKHQYDDDARFENVVSIFTGLAIIVSCLGLTGLSSFTAAQRKKEIGIRKVLGASLGNIVSILSADFIKLIVISAALALPLAYWFIQNWLEKYAYRITPHWTHFTIPVAIVLLIALLTISFQIVKAAMTNPAETIKCD